MATVLSYDKTGSDAAFGPISSNWLANKVYKTGQLVVSGNIIYRVTTNFTSGATFSATNLTPIITERGLLVVVEAGGVYPVRPVTTNPVAFVGPTAPTGGGTTAGGAGAVNGLDLWFKTLS